MRYKRTSGASKGIFRAGNKVHAKNVPTMIPRGGRRL